MNTEHQHHASHAPRVTHLQVIPVAGHDSMLLNLSGAHGPFFTRNIVILKDSAGHIGVGEVPGGERIRETLEDARSLVIGLPITRLRASSRVSRPATAPGAASRRLTCASPSTPSPPWKRRCSTCSASSLKYRWPPCSAKASSATR